MDKTTNSGAYFAGYGTGVASAFFLGGSGKMADAAVKGISKAGTLRGAANIGLRKGGASALMDAPLNTLDAIKMATDSRGNFDKGQFVMWSAINAGISGGMGGLIGGIGAKMTAKQAKQYIAIATKARSGLPLTEDEIKTFVNIQENFARIAETGDVAKNDIVNSARYAKEVGERMQKNGISVDGVVKTLNEASTHSERMAYAETLKGDIKVAFEEMVAERNAIFEQAKKVSPQEAKNLRAKASQMMKTIDAYKQMSNVIDAEITTAVKRNKTALKNLTSAVDDMAEKTGATYRILGDKEMRATINDVMQREADILEGKIARGEIPADELAEAKERLSAMRGGVKDEEFYKGFYYKNGKGETEVLINSEYPHSYQTVVGHETGHIIKTANEQEFFKLGGMLEDYARKNGDWDAVYEELKRNYPNATRKELREEVTCELIGKYLFNLDEKVLKQMANEQPTVLQKIKDYIAKLLGKTADKEMQAELKTILDKFNELAGDVKATGNATEAAPKASKVIKEGDVVQVSDNIPASKLDKSGAIVEKDGTPVAEYDKSGSFKFSAGTYDGSVVTPQKAGREQLTKYLDKLVKTKEMTREEADQIVKEVDNIYDVVKKYADSGEYVPFTRWSNAEVAIDEKGHAIFTSVKKNAEYPMNLDFSTVCKKRRTLDAVFNELVSRGVVDRLEFMDLLDSAKFVVEINNIVREHGFEAACSVCFVEARRYRQHQTAEAFANMYNELVESMYKDKSKIAQFNYGGKSGVKDIADGLHTMDDSMVNTSYLKSVADKEPKTVRGAAAKLLLENPSQRKLVNVGDMMGSTGFENMQKQNPDLMKLYNRKKGTGGAKSSFGDVQYLNEIIRSKTFDRAKAYAVGGVRAQSFSDYVPRMVFDYVQMVGDLAAKRLPMHVYTKEPLFAKQFGLSGIKVNLSLVPDYAKDGIAAGLDKDGKYIWNLDGTFPFDEAMKLQKADGYSQNCGTIAVGVSDMHIEKMLKDPEIQMVIPYHKSSLNPIIADMTNVGEFTDYTKSQITRTKKGKGVKNDFPFNQRLYEITHGKDGKLLPKEKWGNPQDVVDEYLAWCKKKGYTPKFEKFAYHEDPEVRKGYYKLLEDFSLFDNDGNFKPQHDVQAKFPKQGDAFGSMSDLIKEGLEEDAILEGKRMYDIPSIADEVETVAKDKGWLPESKFSKGKKPTYNYAKEPTIDKGFDKEAFAERKAKFNAEEKARLESENAKMLEKANKSTDVDEIIESLDKSDKLTERINKLEPKPAEKPKTEPKPAKPKAEVPAKKGDFAESDEYKTFMNNEYHSAGLESAVENSARYDVDVKTRVGEFNDLNKEIRGLIAKKNASKTPEHIAQYEEEIEAAKIKQTKIAKSIMSDVALAREKVKGIDPVSVKEINAATEKIGGVENFSNEIKKATNVKYRDGSKRAQKVVAEEMKDYDSCLEKYLKGDVAKEADLQNARASALLDNISERLKANPEDTKATEDLLKVVDKISDDGTLPSSIRGSAKEVLTATPKGRVSLALKQADMLNAKYGDRIKGTLKLTDEEKVALMTTPAGKELDDLYVDIAERWWDDIPATRIEKFNEVRHMFMLTNVRTHGRNFFGNIMFRGVRRIADDAEIVMQNKLFKNAIEARGGEVDRVKVSKNEIKKNDEFLTEEFHAAYDKSESRTRWNESHRPDGVPVVKARALNWLIQKDYAALEKEDMFTFIPAFKKSYTQYCKSKGWDMAALTDAQKKMARDRALFDAEYATFRDTSAFSAWLTGKKHMLATKKGKTVFGTAFYRLGNAALEGIIPFVKTPVNIFRRSVDYSPISLIRCLGEFASQDPEVFKQGIKHLSTGLTGTGIFGLGVYLANSGLVSIDTTLGKHSGSKYYDQDMGYQEYSLVLNVGGKKQSWTIDWLQPMQASLFMGAAFREMYEDLKNGEGKFGSDSIAALFAVTAPMFDASFMSSAKDMMETFERRAARENEEGEPDMRGALVQMLLGDVPKNYVSSAIPQVFGQTANILDNKQRDTRSTYEDPLLASWDRAGKQIINRIPVFRNFVLNPKLDRWGEDKKTPENIAIRIFNAAINPSTVKDISENEYDRELFKIRNSLDKGSKAYKDFFYNFTGNPNYSLDNGKRMTYDDAYTYGKASRKEQGKIVKDMIDSNTYKNMTDDMKADEVSNAYDIGCMVADHDTYGVNYAIKRMKNSEMSKDKSDAKTFEKYSKNAGKDKDAEKFWEWRVNKEEMYARSHATDDDIYRVKGICAIESGDDNLVKAVKLTGNKEPELRNYWKKKLADAGGNKKKAKAAAFNEITEFCCDTTSELKKAGIEATDLGIKSAAAGKRAGKKNQFSEDIYRAMGHFWNSAQAGGGLKKYNKDGKYDLEKLEMYSDQLDEKLENRGDKSQKDVVCEFIENDLGVTNADEAACLYQILYARGHANPANKSRWKNPYKDQIDDHLEWGENNDNGSNKGSGGGRRRRGGRRGGGGGGGSGKGMSWDEWLKKQGVGAATRSRRNSGVSDNTSKSALDEAYRKRVRSNLKKTRKI